MHQNTELPLGTELFWNPTPEYVNIPVRVCGIAQTGIPVLGRTYIMELMNGPIEGHSYTHVAAFECHLSPTRI